ncbi:hypothetical protein FB550_105138 [Neobacillus bataviensis]|uniref:Uncharacterized protein n=1 Tax=Neobacillus bataviensis TaxID=220685 RepID=A0A561DEF7_9BACI|nr:hypothetical protein [Neobacillus bataviensis]TWE01770.1 hypothetical protein FB550_105138 [Neobacillus bataviensis]
MMVWTLAGLFGISVILLVISIYRTSQSSKAEHKQIDLIHISTMKEINAIQDAIRNIELDIEVVMREAGVQLTSEDKVFMREVLDLANRNYSTESIADMKQVSVEKIEQMLAPYRTLKEGRKVANEN